ncbi:MAG: glycerol-3-phosphate 1-O-acyltransferase PlsY [Tissierellia bacterium]|nr:glycerol-3-phosphate 1-O-acyltransferase PlsY [Tissierellia bacterium]
MKELVLVLILSYLIGSISGSFILGKRVSHIDIRRYGSGNAGTTNALRVMGKKLALLTFIIDFLKAVLALYLALRLVDKDQVLIAGVGCVLGHDYPFYMNFKGGKGMASTAGILAVFDPPRGLVSILIGLGTAGLSRYVSLGSLLFLTSAWIQFMFFTDISLFNQVCLSFLVVLGFFRHRSNIERLLAGKENKLGGQGGN